VIKTIKENSAEQYIEINTLSVLVPVYNSEKTIEPLVEEIIVTLEPHFNNIEIILVNDGSKDASQEICIGLADKYDFVKFISLRKNFTYHNAVLCLTYVTGDFENHHL
jgi:undecaprenyl-phosphate 4-deoxy-4-formamido-L-arabinose transferase